jgi:hypothetical protein
MCSLFLQWEKQPPYAFYHANCDGEASYTAYFSIMCLCCVPDDGQMEQPEHIAEK